MTFVGVLPQRQVVATPDEALATIHVTSDPHGWPTPARVGREGARAAFLIVQHADRDRAFQEEYLTYLESAVAAGDAPGEALALLTDRVRVAKGEPQLYGTQVNLTPDGLVLLPIEDSLHVDERRAALGMPPLAAYRALLEEAYRQAQKPGGGRRRRERLKNESFDPFDLTSPVHPRGVTK